MTFSNITISDNWKVIKLGGTSQSKIGYDKLIDILKNDTNNYYIIVLSAVSTVTNLLEKYVKTLEKKYLLEVKEKNINLTKDLDLDMDNIITDMLDLELILNSDENMYSSSKIIGTGECISTRIFYEYIQKCLPSEKIQLLSSYDFIRSKKESFKIYQSVEFEGSLNMFTEKYNNSRIVICQGFIASTPSNKTILLGRGGSDTTGSLVANMVTAKEYQVWTDVDGIYYVDPRIIKESKNVKEISYELALEISSMGAKIMHPYSILPCAIKNIPIIVRNTFNLDGSSTVIQNAKLIDEKNNIFFAVQKNITLFKIVSMNMWNAYGFSADIFRIFERIGIDVNIITTSQFSIYTTTDEKNNLKIKQALSELSELYTTEIISDREIVSIISPDIKNYMNKIDYTKINYDIIHFGSNNITINFVSDKNNSNDLIKMLYNTFY
jgi:aspartate kinase